MKEQLKDLRVPVLILYGDRDRFAVAENYAGLSSASTRVGIKRVDGDHHLALPAEGSSPIYRGYACLMGS
jgi:predicted alpha/beta-hydrolase family hydrolase